MINNKAVWMFLVVSILLVLSAGAIAQVSLNGFTAATGSVYDFTLSTLFRIRASAGAVASSVGGVAEDTTTAMYHNFTGGVDSIFGTFPTSTSITNGDCVGWSSSGGLITLTDTGNPCSSGGGVTLTKTICSGTAALGTGAIASGAQATTVTATCTGLLTSDNMMLDFNSSPLAVTGYIPSTGGMLTIIKWPTSNTINIAVVNNTALSITPGAITLNYRVVR